MDAADGGRDEVKIEVSRNYMFYAAFENSVYPDYVTEKVYHGLIAGSVPIYIGARNVLAFVPDPNSIITVGSLGEVPAVVNEIKRLMNNRTTYEVSGKQSFARSFWCTIAW